MLKAMLAAALPPRRTPPTPANDTVVPLSTSDSNIVFQQMPVNFMAVFDTPLDAERLQKSLDSLIQRRGWVRLGARLRRCTSGQLEYHIPSEFNDNRAAFVYRNITIQGKISDHPVAGRLPMFSNNSSSSWNPDNFKKFLCPSKCMGNTNHYLYRDVPQLAVHLTSFSDATILSMAFPHTLFDILGLKDLLDTWGIVLRNPDVELTMPKCTESSPISLVARQSNTTHYLSPYHMSKLDIIMFGCRNLTRMMWPHKHRRTIYLSAGQMDKLRDEARAGLGGEAQKQVFISDGDILCAWWTRFCTQKLSKKRRVVLIYAQSIRPFLPAQVFPKGVPFISNAIGFIYIHLKNGDIQSGSLGSVANGVRQDVSKSQRQEQVEAYAALWENSWPYLPPIMGHHDMYPIFISNWSKAKLFDITLPAAAANMDENGSLKPRFIHGYVPGNFADMMLVTGRDADGGYWLDCTASLKTLTLVDNWLHRH